VERREEKKGDEAAEAVKKWWNHDGWNRRRGVKASGKSL